MESDELALRVTGSAPQVEGSGRAEETVVILVLTAKVID
jgi:hypothetical protein